MFDKRTNVGNGYYTRNVSYLIAMIGNGQRKSKGNVDAELVLYAGALTFKQYAKAIIVSGDGDFLCLAEYLDAENKLLRILAPNFKYSNLLKRYAPKIIVVGDMKDRFERTKKTGLAGRSKP